MKKWEYKLQTIYGHSVHRLNELGERGWELVSVVPKGDKFLAILKREKE